MHPHHDAAFTLICLFQEGGSVADFQEGGADPFVDLLANELELLDLGNAYVNAMSKDAADGITDVANGIVVVADGEALSLIWNLGKWLVVLKLLFDYF